MCGKCRRKCVKQKQVGVDIPKSTLSKGISHLLQLSHHGSPLSRSEIDGLVKSDQNVLVHPLIPSHSLATHDAQTNEEK